MKQFTLSGWHTTWSCFMLPQLIPSTMFLLSLRRKTSGSLIPTPQPWPLNINELSKMTLHMPQRMGDLWLQNPHKCFPKVQLDMVFTGSLQRTIQRTSTDRVKSPLFISEWRHWHVPGEVLKLYRNCMCFWVFVYLTLLKLTWEFLPSVQLKNKSSLLIQYSQDCKNYRFFSSS